MALKLFKKYKSGQSLAEWSLIIALISIVVVAALSQWGGHMNNTTVKVNNALNSVNTNINTTT